MLRPPWQVSSSLGNSITQSPNQTREARGFQLLRHHVQISCDYELTSLLQQQTRDLAEFGHIFWATGIGRWRCVRRNIEVRGPPSSRPFHSTLFFSAFATIAQVAASIGELPAHRHASFSQTCWMVTQRQRKTFSPDELRKTPHSNFVHELNATQQVTQHGSHDIDAT